MQGCLAHDMHNWKEINADKRRKAVLDRLDDTTKDSQDCENVEELLIVFLRSVSQTLLYVNKYYCVATKIQKWTYSATRLIPWPPNKFSHLKITYKYVNSKTHAMVINLQQCEFCKEASLSIKFTHPEWRTICKKKLCQVATVRPVGL